MTGTKRSLGWEDIFKCYPIFDSICAYLDPKDIYAFRLTTKQLSPFFEILFRSQWNINRKLTRFVRDPIGLRSQLGRHGALISGSFAVQFFDRGVWEAGLDVYVHGSNADGLGEYLVGREGYVVRDVRTEENGGLVEFTRQVKHISQVRELGFSLGTSALVRGLYTHSLGMF